MTVDPDKRAPQGSKQITPSGEVVDKVDEFGNLKVILQDQTTTPLDLYFLQQKSVTTLTAPVAKDDTVINVASATGMLVGDFIGIFSGVSGENRFYFGEILIIATLAITLDTPIDFEFEAGDPVLNSTRDLNVNGSVTPQIFTVTTGTGIDGIEVDITRFIISMVSSSAMDDSKFAHLSKLTNGLVLRQVDGTFQNIFNVILFMVSSHLH